jgi:hypothetical protein
LAGAARHDRGVFHSNRWYRRHWPRDAEPDPRFDGYDHRIAELWDDAQVAGYMYMLVLQTVQLAGPLWRRTLRHAGWYPEIHFAFRPSPDEPIAGWDFDSMHSWDEETATGIYEQILIPHTVTWDGKKYDLLWVEDPEETQRIIDQHFWEYDVDLSKPE